MRRTVLLALTAALAALAPAATAAPPAFSGPGTFVLVGSGSVFPGLDLSNATRSYAFAGTATVVTASGSVQTWGCSFTALLDDDTIVEGHGPGTADCGPWPVMDCLVGRVLLELTYACTGNGTLAAAFAMQPSDVNPMRHYSVAGGGEGTPAHVQT
ncbi:MAG TPA: hypothetical protein VF519_04255 [Mycobacteriales bacterium]